MKSRLARRPNLRRAVLLAVASTALALSPARGAEPPTDPEAFAVYAAHAFVAAIPGAIASVPSPLTLSVIAPGVSPYTVYLHRTWAFCERNRPKCGDALARFVQSMAPAIVDSDGPELVTREKLRAAIRPLRYVEQARAVMRTKGHDDGPVAAPLAGDLWVVCFLDGDTTTRTIVASDLAKLGLTREQAIAVATENVVAELKPERSVARALRERPFGILTGSFYESSRLLMHRTWSRHAKAANGSLVVAVPAHDLVIYGKGDSPAAIAALRAAVEDAARHAERPLSLTLLKWTAAGWQPLPP